MTLCIGGSCYCFSNPAAPHRLLTWYVQTQGPAEADDLAGTPVSSRKDLVVAKKILKFLEDQHGVRSSVSAHDFTSHPGSDLNDAFFSEEDPYSNPRIMSDLKLPFRDQAADMRYAPIETGPVVHSNPYLQ